MANGVTFFKKGWHFLTERLWNIRVDKLDKRQGFFIKQLRIFSLSIKGFNEDKCLVKATALTFYTLFSIVPVVALAFAVAKGFGYDKTLQGQILNDYREYSSVLNQVFMYADSLLQTTRGGLIAGVGVLLLLWSVIQLLSSIENSFNEIWEISKGRTWYRKITDYLTIMIIGPIFLIVSGSLTVIIQTRIADVMFLSTATTIILKFLAFFMLCGVFTFIYIVLPNTKVHYRSAFYAGLIAALLFEILQWAYITFQVGASRYNAIYGSFAALPLFLIWVQYSWYLVLFGAELAFANQNVDHYELETEIKNISSRYKRVIALMISNVVVKNFNEGKTALTAIQLAHQLDLPVRLARIIINELVEVKVFSETKIDEDHEVAYQPALTDSKLSVKFVIDKLDEKGVNELPISDSRELQMIHRLMHEMDEVLNNDKGNVLIKDLN